MRPAVIHKGSCKILIHVHDDYYERTVKALKKIIRDVHPDRRKFTRRGLMRKRFREVLNVKRANSCTAFLEAQRRLDRFIAHEIKWYGQYGLTPPDGRTVEEIQREPLALGG